jgi:Cd2+/Zn2+-exporting ATPase
VTTAGSPSGTTATATLIAVINISSADSPLTRPIPATSRAATTPTASDIAEQAGLDDFRANLLPDEKVEALEELLAEHGQVAMVGDGINDAPALARATVGIAMGGAGTDQALETANVALMADALDKLPFAMRLSRRTLNVVRQNISFSLLVKGTFMALTIPGLTTLWMAVFADTGVSLIVILNGMRLLRNRT